MKLYKVTFTFDDSYRIETVGFRSIQLVVSAEGQFKALDVAWKQVACLNLPEPKEFNAVRADKD